MVANVTFNPIATSNASGSFGVSWDGYIQGTMMDDPSSRQWLSGGVLASSETVPMWGGVPIAEHVPSYVTTDPVQQLGGQIIRATTNTAAQSGTVTGFSVFNQAHHAMTTPQSPVPLIVSGQSVNFFRLGSQARVVVAADPGLASLRNGIITAQVSWDFNNSVLQAFDSATATFSITSLTAGAYSASLGGYPVVVVGAVAVTTVQAVGDLVNISGATNTGTGGNAAVNGNFAVTAFTDNQHFTIFVPAASGGVGTIAGTILANAGVGALNVKVLDVATTGCMTVSYNSTTGQATWNRNGSCALIQL